MFFWKDIYFRCPCCRKPLAVERAAAGGKAPCPGCKASISIPRRSGVPPKLVRRMGVVVLNVAVVAALSFAGIEYFRRKAGPEVSAEPVRQLSPLEKALAEKRRTPPPALAANAAKFNTSAMDEMRAKSIELAEKNAKLQTQFEGMAKWVLENYEGKYPLPLNLVSNLNLAAVGSNYTLSADVVQLLRVTPEEKAKVDGALEDALFEMTRWAMAMSELKVKAADSAHIVVPPFEKEGAAVRAKLMNSMEEALGGPRADKFADVTRQGLNEAYGYFGSAARELLFQLVPQEGGNPAYLLITDGFHVPQGESMTRYNSKQIAVMSLPAEYGEFIDHLPQAIKALDHVAPKQN